MLLSPIQATIQSAVESALSFWSPSDPLSAYAVNGKTPGLVASAINDFYHGADGATDFATLFPTFARASTATYFDSTGTIQTAAVDEPRVNSHVYEDGQWVNKGVLIETEARTNVQRDGKFPPAGGDGLTETTQTEDAGNGIPIQYYDAAASQNVAQSGFFLGNLFSTSANGSAAVSFFLDSQGHDYFRLSVIDASGITEIDLSGPSPAITNLEAGGLGAEITPITGTIYLIQVWGTGSGNSSSSFRVGPIASTGTNLSPATVTSFGIGLLQTEIVVGPPSSIIPTDGAAATRAADLPLTIPAALVPAYTTEVSMAFYGAVTYEDKGILAQMQLMHWRVDTQNYIIFSLETVPGTGRLNTQARFDGDISEAQTDISFLVPGIDIPISAASAWSTSAIKAFYAGDSLRSGATSGIVDLNAEDLDLAYVFMGHISEFRLWTEALTDAELEEVTS